MFKNIPKLTVPLLVFVLILPLFSGFLLAPKAAKASVPIHCSAFDFNCQKESILDEAARMLTSALIQSLTSMIIGWIQGNGGQDVGFVSNFEREFRRAINRRGAEFLNNLAGVNLCGNIGANLYQPLRIGLGGRRSIYRDLGCTLDQIVQNLENFYRNFNQGGWETFLSTNIIPRHNYDGAFLTALDYKLAEEAAAARNLTAAFQAHKGFLGYRVEAQTRCEPNPDPGAPPYCFTEYETKTPGGLIADTLNKTVNLGLDFAVAADEMDEAIGSIINALLNRLYNASFGGGGGIFDPGLGSAGATGLVNPLATEIQSIETRANQIISGRIQPAVNAWLAELATTPIGSPRALELQRGIDELGAPPPAGPGPFSRTAALNTEIANARAHSGRTDISQALIDLSQIRIRIENINSEVSQIIERVTPPPPEP